MDYLILTIKVKYQTTCGDADGVAYLCANGISRCKDENGKDGIQFVISGGRGWVPIENVLCITPSTPTPQQYEVFK